MPSPGGGKLPIYRDTEMRVSSISGTGSKRRPFVVSVSQGCNFHHFDPDDLEIVPFPNRH